MKLQRHSNQEWIDLQAATELGVGGEAKVYGLSEDLTRVAKVYHKLKPEYGPKLAAMVENPPNNPTASQNHLSFAWPEDLLLNQKQEVVGFLMPRISGMRPIIDLYNPKTRRTQWPWFEYSRLHRTARNLAGALKSLHERGYVIGDVNESNILVTETTLITLVDMDSIQVKHPQTQEVYRCPVGKPEFTPPELQGQSFGNLNRTPEQDCFGLAVLIFQLLMEGTHPFAGVYKLPGDPPAIAQRISEGYFPHGTRSVPLTPMPVSPPFTLLHPKLQVLFRRCFEEGFDNPHVRPDAKMWQLALQDAERDLITCSKNDQHRYGNHLDRCPWCDRTQRLNGRDPFPSQGAVQRGLHLKPVNRKKIPIQPAPTHHWGGHRVSNAPSTVPGWSSFTPLPPSNSGYPQHRGGGAIPVMQASWRDRQPPSLHPLLAGMFVLSLAVAGVWYGNQSNFREIRFRAPQKIELSQGNVQIRLAHTIDSQKEPINAIAMSPKGQLLASNGTEGTVKLWELPNGSLSRTLNAHQDRRGSYAVSAIALSPDGKLLASASRSDNSLKLWHLENNQQRQIESQEGLQGVVTLAISSEYKILATGSRDRTVKLWDLYNGFRRLTFSWETGWVNRLALTPDQKTLIAGTDTGNLYQVNLINLQDKVLPKVTNSAIEALIVMPDNQGFIVGQGSQIFIRDLASGAVQVTLLHPGEVRALAVSPDGKLLASGGGDRTIQIWNLETQEAIGLLRDHDDEVLSLAFSPQGDLLVSGGADGNIKIWQVSESNN
ncbi:hypothetical protein PJF56_15275 [Roseofilum sp. BLCC_M91]|uniref:Protein kinase domain-containing protein n=1 Tax=Roseofilum halophilum BLCC-M91 TaxID=3022259 RepID=A0ABT7BM07_9CYAN|nr:hypothetical protein [Roseofilum halophilum]MDJ1180224.1 hypothetical protein [Roseofilum halophilum BLCC-M91]